MPPSMASPETPRFGAMSISATELTEWQDGRPVVCLARDDVHQVNVAYGLVAERLVLQLLFSIGLIVVATVLTASAMLGAIPTKAVYCAPAIGFGAWMAHHVLERGFVVNVTTVAGENRKLRLGRELEHATAFVAEARRLGWTLLNQGPLSR